MKPKTRKFKLIAYAWLPNIDWKSMVTYDNDVKLYGYIKHVGEFEILCKVKMVDDVDYEISSCTRIWGLSGFDYKEHATLENSFSYLRAYVSNIINDLKLSMSK